MRNSKNYNLEWFYNYYKDNGGNLNSLQQFGGIFNMGNLDQILEFLDHKYDLKVLSDKDGKYIKVYE